jgi:hypothetical protein
MIPTTPFPFPFPTAPRDHDEWLRLLIRQHGVVSRRQLLRHGFTHAAIRANVRAGRWAHVHGGKPIHVTVSYAASGASRAGVVVHRSRAFAYTVVEGTDQPVVAASHTAVDLAVAEPTARHAMATMLHCLTVTSLRPESVRASIDLRRPRRYSDALLAAIGYASDGVRSKLEAIYALEVEEAHGLPRGERQLPVDVDGTTRHEDIAYRVADEVVIVRLDGHRYHADRATTLVDRRRDLAAELAGRGRVVLGYEETAADPCARAREVAAVLRRRGWVGALRACERCWSP